MPSSHTIRLMLLCGAVSFYFFLYARAWPTAPVTTNDTSEYLDLANRFASGTWTDPHDRMPGYPLLLVPFRTDISTPARSLFYFQLLLHAAAVGLIANTLRRLGGSPALCIVLGAVLLLPPFVDEAAVAMSECFTGFLLACLTYCIVRWLTDHSVVLAWLAGTFAAAAFLVRPVYLFLGPAAAVAFAVISERAQRPRGIMGLVLPSIVVFGTFLTIQYARFGYLGLTPKAGFMLFTRTLHVLERIPDDHAEYREILIRHRDRSLTERGSSHTGTQFMWDGGLEELLSHTGSSRVELSREMLKVNLDLIERAPLHYLLTVAKTTTGCWFPPATSLAHFGSRALHLVWAMLHFTLVAFYALALCCFISVLVRRSAGCLSLFPASSLHAATPLVEAFAHLSLWYTAVLSSLAEVGDPRYMRPVLPLLVMVVLFFLIRWNELRRQLDTATIASPGRTMHQR